MNRIARYAKFVVAAIGAAATAISTAAVPDAWKTIAAIIASVITALSVYAVPNKP